MLQKSFSSLEKASYKKLKKIALRVWVTLKNGNSLYRIIFIVFDFSTINRFSSINLHVDIFDY